ncbi:MAG: hypothetical protein PHF46_04315, partial [Candidatus Gracilibacteria bacterium]|nr:hypothetical protein [Candidatus Gracilibacteria bacterium]
TKEIYVYDSLGRLVSANDNTNNSLSFSYDSLGRLLSETNNGKSVSYSYDSLGNMLELVYPSGRKVSRSFDSLNRMTNISSSSLFGSSGSVANYSYNGITLNGLNYSNGSNTSYTYNNLLRLKDLSNRSGGDGSGNGSGNGTGIDIYSRSYTYDNVGNILNNGKDNYTYNSLYELTGVNYGDSLGSESFAYDKMGNRTTSLSSSGQLLGAKSLSYATNNLNQYTQVSGEYENSGSGVVVYDNNGNIVENDKYRFRYDYQNRLVEVVEKEKKIVVEIPNTATNSGNESETGDTLPDTSSQTGSEIQEAGTTQESGTPENTGSTETGSGSESDSGSGETSSGETESGATQESGTITEPNPPLLEAETGSGATVETGTGTETSSGTETESGAGETNTGSIETGTGETGTGSETESGTETGSGTDSPGSSSQTGSGIQEGGTPENTGSIIVTIPEHKLSTYSYDLLGRRIGKTVESLNYKVESDGSTTFESGSTVTKFVYSGQQTVEETETSLDSSGNTVKTASKEYIYGNGGIDDVVAVVMNDGEGSRTYYYHKDNLGSTVAITDESGNIVEKYRYDVFGKSYVYATVNSGGQSLSGWIGIDEYEKISGNKLLGNSRLYTGREYDSETGLYFYRARYYDSESGRFISRDPVGMADQVNLYSYVGNNSINATDPKGTVKKMLGNLYDSLKDFYSNAKDGWADYYQHVQTEKESDDFFNKVSAYVSDFTIAPIFNLLGNGDKMSGGEKFMTIAFIAPWNKGGKVIKGFSKYIDGGVGFKSFDALKRYIGKATDGNAIHHIVEKNKENVIKFGEEIIHNTKNVVEIPHKVAGDLHRQISGYYSSNQVIGGKLQKVRDYVKTLSFDEQYQEGIRIIKLFGGGKYLK